MSHYKSYPAYKDSGVEWLGMIPEHWKLKRIRYLSKLNPSVRNDIQENDELNVSFLPMEAIGEDGTLNLERVRSVAEVKSGYSYFEDGDVAFAKVTPCFENGKGALMTGLIQGVGFGTTELTILRPNLLSSAEFLNYAVQTDMFRSLGVGAMTGAGGLKRVPDEFTRNFPLPTPSLDEQNIITAHLDRETARLNSLITKKTRFIELLKEKRQALITQAVTKGLDPHVKMKDSGVEWIGKIPEEWNVKPLFSITEERNKSNKGMIENNLLSLSYGFIVKKDINSFEGLVPESYETYQIVEKNDIIFRLTDLQNDKRSLRSAICRERGIITSAYLALNPKNISSAYLSNLMRSYDQTKVFYSMGGGMRQSMKYGDMRRMMVLQPSNAEQLSISNFLDRETARIDILIQKSVHSITLLKERRSALITAAVTGQIDLREAA